jgi:hypothetical protein
LWKGVSGLESKPKFVADYVVSEKANLTQLGLIKKD